MDLCEQSPSYIRAIAPYQPGKPISELAREMGLKEKNIIKLASNENPLGVSPRAKAAIKRALAELARYPDGNAFELKAALSRRHGVPEECIVVGNGSNDLLEMVAGAFLAPGRAALYSQHAFAVYPLATQARGARSIVVPAKNYGHDLAAMLAAITPETRVVFIANPNNPTGTFVPGAELEAFIERAPREVAEEIPELHPDAHLLQDLRARGPAGGLRPDAAGRGRAAQPRAPALQRQQPRPRRRRRGARGPEIRREEHQDEPRGHGQAGARAQDARPRDPSLVRQLR